MKFLNVLLIASIAIICLSCGGEGKLAEYNSPSGKFKIYFPGNPKVSSTTGQNNVQVTVYAVEGFNYVYTVNHYDAPVPLPQNEAGAQAILTAEPQGIFQGANGAMQAHNFIKLQDRYFGINYTGTITKPRSLNLRGRTFITAQRVYNVLVMGSAEKVNSDIATKFLDSFRIEP